MKFANFLKSRIIFNVLIPLFLYVSKMFLKQTFHLTHVLISQKIKGVLM